MCTVRHFEIREFCELTVSKNVPNYFYFLKAYNTLHFPNLFIIMTWYKC